MGEDYLTEAAEFACSCRMSFKAEEKTNNKAFHSGKKLLTSGALLIPFAPFCKDPKAPKNTPCIPVIITGGVRHKAEKTSLLTMSDTAVCKTMGKTIKPKKSGSNGHVMYKKAHPAQVATIAWPMPESPEKSQLAANRANQLNLQVSQKSPKHKSCVVSSSESDGKSQKSIEPVVPQKTSSTESEETLSFREGMLCSHSKNKSVCRECAYRLDNELATVNNNSVILRKNYNATKPHFDEYDSYFDGTVEPLGDGKTNKWSYAAHHLISGNQVFKQNAELVRLARFCGYDINSYENCIMLVGYPEDYPDEERMKSVKAYDVMSEGRIQWHVGGHSYTFTKEEKAEICKQIGIRNKIKLTPGDIKTYAELVQAEVEKLQSRLTVKKDRHMVCYADMNAKQQLCEKLNRISQKIKAKLAAFSDIGKPHHSFPFFVSKEAYRYTYALPRTGKVITVLKEGSRLTLSMFRLEHFTEAIAERDKSLRIKPKNSVIMDLTDEMWQINCILFCDNVSFFVYLNDTPRNILPFSVDKDHQFPVEMQTTGKDGQKYLEEHDTEILVWLRDNPLYGYISPALMVKGRSEEYLFDE